MAIQVRLDLTPSEFDLARRALDSYILAQIEQSKTPEPKNYTPDEYREWRKAKDRAMAEAAQSQRLREKLNV